MTSALRKEMRRVKRSAPGKRFLAFNQRQRTHARGPMKWLYLGATILSLIVGVVLVVIPGPAFVFFILAGALLAAQSKWIARRLDRFEVWSRRVLSSIRARWHAHVR